MIYKIRVSSFIFCYGLVEIQFCNCGLFSGIPSEYDFERLTLSKLLQRRDLNIEVFL